MKPSAAPHFKTGPLGARDADGGIGREEWNRTDESWRSHFVCEQR